MNYHGQLTIRNTPTGLIWQIYNIETEQEYRLISETARANGFGSIRLEPSQGEEDTFVGWRESTVWQERIKADNTANKTAKT